MKYFLHDTNAFQDEKVAELFIAHGYEGLGLFYSILEKLAYQEKPVKTAVLKKQLSVGKKLEKCWSFLEEIDLISSNNGETFNNNLLKFSEKYQVSKEKNRERVAQWREKQADTKPVTHYERVRNAPKVKESKVKEDIASKAGEAESASPIESSDEPQRLTPRAPKQFRYDNAPVFIITEFFDYLTAQGYGHVDKGMYLVRITEHVKNTLADPQQRKIKPEATNDEWKKFILAWLDRDKGQKKLLLPDSAPVASGYPGPNPALQIVPTTTSNYGAGRMAAQADKLYL